MPLNKEKVLQFAKAFNNRARNCIVIARRRVDSALQHAYVGRKLKKRQWRAVWIQRINAGTREHGVSDQHWYSFVFSPQRTTLVYGSAYLPSTVKTAPGESVYALCIIASC